MNTMCDVCGDIGFKHLLLYCSDCTSSAVHRYCLEKVVFDASLPDWVCYECLQKRGEATGSRSLEIMSSEKQPSPIHFYSRVHQPVTKRVELSSDVGLWKNRKSHVVKYKCGNKLFSSRVNASRKKLFKRKPNIQPKDNCTYKQISTSTDHDKLEPSSPTVEHENSILKKYGDTSNGMRNNGANISSEQLSTLQNNALDNEMPGAPNDGGGKVLSSDNIKKVLAVRETNVQPFDASISSQHGKKGSFWHRGKTVKMATTSTSLEESDDVQVPPRGDYILSRTSYLSKAQKERVMAFIQETKPETTVFVSVIGKSSVQLPGPYLGISKEYAFAYFPHESTKVTIQMPGMSKTWHPLFYKRNESRKNFLMGQWLDFVRDNNVQEGDIFLLEPKKDETRSTFTVYLLRASATHATGGDCFQKVGPYPGKSIGKITSEVHIMEEPANVKHVSSERVMHEHSHDSLEREDPDDPTLAPYIVPCRHDLSKSQKKIVEERVRAIRSEFSIYVTVMKNNNAGSAQRWMLELGVRYASEYLPAVGQTVVLRRMGKTWNTQMVIHNGRRWFLNGGWTKFARDNGLRVGDICLFELKQNETKLTMEVHIIYKEQV